MTYFDSRDRILMWLDGEFLITSVNIINFNFSAFSSHSNFTRHIIKTHDRRIYVNAFRFHAWSEQYCKLSAARRYVTSQSHILQIRIGHDLRLDMERPKPVNHFRNLLSLVRMEPLKYHRNLGNFRPPEAQWLYTKPLESQRSPYEGLRISCRKN